MTTKVNAYQDKKLVLENELDEKELQINQEQQDKNRVRQKYRYIFKFICVLSSNSSGKAKGFYAWPPLIPHNATSTLKRSTQHTLISLTSKWAYVQIFTVLEKLKPE